MAKNLQDNLRFNYKQILIDEIALEGLSGITCDLLWKRVEKRVSIPVTDKMKARLWSFIVNCHCVTFYKVPDPVPCIDILDRFMIVDEASGHLKDSADYLDGHYEYCPVETDFGSCSNYKTRKEIQKEKLKSLNYTEVVVQYPDTLVMVSSLEERWRALAPHMPETVRSQLTPIHYCILELVGKARDNGQMTVGKTNLTKIVNEPKFLFYNRKHLQSLGLITVACLTLKVGGKGVKSLILRLKRFHQPSILTMPKVGKLHNVKEHLLAQPDYSEKTDVIISKGLITQQNNKRLQKTVNIFNYEEKLVQPDPGTKNGKAGVAVKRRFISLNSISDESSQSEDEDEVPLKCQYKVGVDLLRQAYERLLDAGRKGLTQIELAQLLGVEFYTSRSICRIFKARHIIREYLEDRGKQRTARYFAIAAATMEMDQKYEEEKNKLLEYINTTKTEDPEEDDDEIPLKKIKLAKAAASENVVSAQPTPSTVETEVTEIKVLDGLENFNSASLLFSKKNPTLRQLKFANGLLKVTRERLAISGYHNLTNLVSKESGEPPLDTKALKIFVQKLVTDGQLKLMKIKWPTHPHKYSIIICAPHVKSTDPIIKLKQREISIRAFTNNKVKKQSVEPVHRPISQYAYPRYMKIQLLHEFLFKLIYVDKVVHQECHMPLGFASLVNVIPEITIEFAIGNISNMAMSDISHVKVDQDLSHVKLRDAPRELYQILLQSKSLQCSIRSNLKVLAMLGLIQLTNPPAAVSAEHSATLSNYSFYLNRRAKLLDTTGKWPREVDKESLEKTFYFETFDDVKNYWSEVYEISTHTTIEHKSRNRKQLIPPVRKAAEVEKYDNGEVFGNGFGPCGFDACFFMELARFWKSFYIRIIKNKPTKKPSLKRKLVTEKKPKKIVKVRRRRQPPPPPPPRDDIHPRIKVPLRRCVEPALRWSEWEDMILIMCKVAITIISPTSQPGCLKIRNTTARDLLAIFDPKKIGSICHRRALALETNMTLQYEKECLINELRRRRDLIVKYEGLLKKLRLKYCRNMVKFVNEARIPMFELIWLINQLVKNKSYLKSVPCVAMNIDDFYQRFEVSSTSANKPFNIYRTDAESDLQLTVVKETIIMSLMANFNVAPSNENANKVFAILKEFPEATLRMGLDQLRKCSAVACSNKVLNTYLHRLDVQDTVQSSYKISAAYRRKWINRQNTDLPDLIADILDSKMPQNQIKASPEVNCTLCEFQTSGMLEIIMVTLPVITGPSGSIIHEQQLNVLDIEMKYKLKSGILGWKKITDFQKFSDAFDISIEEVSTLLQRNAELQKENYEEVDDDIATHLKEKGEKGALHGELRNDLDLDSVSLKQRLDDLKSKKIIKQVGYYENRIVLTEFAEPWGVKLGEKLITPTPWRTLEGDIRYNVFFQWAGVIINKVFELPGCSIAFLSNTYEYITTRAVQEICTFLEECQCVKLKVLNTPEIDLFSDDEPQEFTDYNQFERPENIFVFPLKDTLTKYAFLRKRMLPKRGRNIESSEKETV